MPETIEMILKKHGRTSDEMIPILQDVQKEFGYIGPESVKRISRYLKLSENLIFGVTSFYAQFRFTEPGRHTIKVCLGTACYVRGGQQMLAKVEDELKVKVGGTTDDRRFSVDVVRCIGACGLAPAILVNDDVYGRVKTTKVIEILDTYE